MKTKNALSVALILCSSFTLGQTSTPPKPPANLPPTLSKEETLELDLLNTKAALIQTQAQGQLGQLQSRMSDLRAQIAKEHPGYYLSQQGTLVANPPVTTKTTSTDKTKSAAPVVTAPKK